MDWMSFGIGFIAGAVSVALVVCVVLSNRIKALSVGKEGIKIETPDRPALPEPELEKDVEQEIEVQVSRRWLTRPDQQCKALSESVRKGDGSRCAEHP
jgi:hypothetical protein